MGNGETNSPATLPDKPTPNAEQALQLDILAHHHHHHHHSSPSLVLPSSPKGTPGAGDDDDDQHHHQDIDDGGGGGGRPNQNDRGGNELEQSTTSTRPPMTFTNSPCILYKDDVAVTGGLATAPSPVPVRAFQPFDVSITNSVASKSPGGGGGGGMATAAALGFPFTPVQWKELERQAMIYKYMIASVPVPPHLLLPVPPRNFPADPTFPWNDKGPLVYNLRYAASTNKDLEPGRCKRTDGKKWRCSRDVAPHQKYCERHMHRSRPRSRKPVELHSSVDTTTTTTATTANNKKSRLQTTPTMHTAPVGEPNKYSSSPRFLGTNSCGDHQPKEALFLNAPSSFPSPTNYNQPSRVFGWSMEGEVVSENAVKQQWLHLMDAKRGLGATDDDSSIFNTNSCCFEQGYGEEPLYLFSYNTDFAPGNIQNNHNRDQCHVFLENSDLIPSEHPRLEQHGNLTRGFIDAWSNGDLKTMEESSTVASPEENLYPDTLTLSMALDEGMELATPVSNPAHKAKCGPIPWLPFNSGGPLAEVLRPSNCIPIGSNPASPYTSNGDSISPPATSVSSPTGILHKALFSHSDSSVCNSPNVAATPDLVAFQWLN